MSNQVRAESTQISPQDAAHGAPGLAQGTDRAPTNSTSEIKSTGMSNPCPQQTRRTGLPLLGMRKAHSAWTQRTERDSTE